MTESIDDPYLLRGLVWCRRHREPRLMAPVRRPDGTRVYSCHPDRQGHDVLAESLESDLLLRALIRATVKLHPHLGHTIDLGGDLEPRPQTGNQDGLAIDAEAARWQRCRLGDRRAVIVTAYPRVDIDIGGQVRPVWRHHADRRRRAQPAPAAAAV